MNYGISYNPDTVPGNNATDSTYLFNTLGYFWRRLFNDKETVRGLVMGQAAAADQAYTQLLSLVDSYSAYTIPIFDKRNWYPLYVYKSSLDNNTLLFGEGVKFGDTVKGDFYIFGDSKPEEPNVYSMILPKELKSVNVIVDQIITPTKTWIPDVDISIRNRRLFFQGNPFDEGLTSVPVFNDNGTRKTYTHRGVVYEEELLLLWCYKAELDADNLRKNIGYLFGLNVPRNEQGKQILASVVKLFTNGPTVADLKTICLSCLNLPIITKAGTVDSVDDTNNLILTVEGDEYDYPANYKMRPEIVPGFELTPGYIPVQGVEFFDNTPSPGWFDYEFGIDIVTPDARKAINPEVEVDPETVAAEFMMESGKKLLPLELPPAMLLFSSKHSLLFENKNEIITMNDDGYVTFPVKGDYRDVKEFQKIVNTTAFKNALNTALYPILTPGSVQFMNPALFIFNSVLVSSAALLRIKFFNTDDLTTFQNSFSAIKDMLPPNVYLIVLCDLSIGDEVFEVNTLLDDSNMILEGRTIGFNYPVDKSGQNELVSFNSGSGLLIKDMTFSRIPQENPISEQYSLSLTVLS